MKILYITALITLFGVLLPHSVSAQFDELSVYVSIPQNADMTPNEMLAILESIEAGINEHSGLKIGKTIDESQLIVHTLCIRTEDYGYAVGVTALIPAAEGEALHTFLTSTLYTVGYDRIDDLGEGVAHWLYVDVVEPIMTAN